MLTGKHIDVIRDNLYSALEENIQRYKENHSYDLSTVSYTEAYNIVNNIIISVRSLCAVYFEDYTFPSFISRFRVFADSEDLESADTKVTDITVTMRSSLSSTTKYADFITFTSKDDVIDVLMQFFKQGLLTLLDNALAQENIDALNAYIAEITAESDATFKFALGTSYIMDIDDKVVTFGTSVRSAFDIDASYLMRYTEDYDIFSRALAEDEKNAIISETQSKNTAQLVTSRLSIIDKMVGGLSYRRADKLIRNIVHRNAKFLDTISNGIGYVRKFVKINDEIVDIFALIEKDKEGTYSVKLSPFDVRTALNVDYDVIATREDDGEPKPVNVDDAE